VYRSARCRATIQGTDQAGFFTNVENGQLSIFGLPVKTTTAIAKGTALVGEFKSCMLFVGMTTGLTPLPKPGLAGISTNPDLGVSSKSDLLRTRLSPAE
jgi:hypothetical protein